MNWLTDPQVWLALVTLTSLEIVLGVDNIIFISILSGKLQHRQQKKARLLGLLLAMLTRIALLFSLSLLMGLTVPLFSVLHHGISGRDIILIAGGIFLLAKSTLEIHAKLEGEEGRSARNTGTTFARVIVQIILLDIIFSLDSIITALGMSNKIGVMVAAVILAVAFMMIFSGSISAFVDKHPTIKMLALAFLILIGVALVGDGLNMHIPKGYIYFAMAFSVGVEMLNMRLRAKGAPVRLHQPY